MLVLAGLLVYTLVGKLSELVIRGIVLDWVYPAESVYEVLKPCGDLENAVLAALQGGLPRSRTPFCDAARSIGIPTAELLAILNVWTRDGTIRRFGAIVDHFQAGWREGAMVVWKVEPDRVEEVGRVFAGFEEVSHAYERETAPGWDYNLYTMVHAASAEAVQRTVMRMREAAGVTEYLVLSTRKELKKAAPRYVE